MTTPKKSKAKLNKNNTTGYIGVSKIADGKYTARYRNTPRLGYFKTAVEAAKAYDAKALEVSGEKAKLNFPINK